MRDRAARRSVKKTCCAALGRSGCPELLLTSSQQRTHEFEGLELVRVQTLAQATIQSSLKKQLSSDTSLFWNALFKIRTTQASPHSNWTHHGKEMPADSHIRTLKHRKASDWSSWRKKTQYSRT